MAGSREANGWDKRAPTRDWGYSSGRNVAYSETEADDDEDEEVEEEVLLGTPSLDVGTSRPDPGSSWIRSSVCGSAEAGADSSWKDGADDVLELSLTIVLCLDGAVGLHKSPNPKKLLASSGI